MVNLNTDTIRGLRRALNRAQASCRVKNEPSANDYRPILARKPTTPLQSTSVLPVALSLDRVFESINSLGRLECKKSTGAGGCAVLSAPFYGVGTTMLQRCSFFAFAAASRQAANAALL
jgi:hypothetical protein